MLFMRFQERVVHKVMLKCQVRTLRALRTTTRGEVLIRICAVRSMALSMRCIELVVASIDGAVMERLGRAADELAWFGVGSEIGGDFMR